MKSSPHLQVGSLYIITCSGATLGREKDLGHTILIPDTQISKVCWAGFVLYDQDYFIYLYNIYKAVVALCMEGGPFTIDTLVLYMKSCNGYIS